MKSNSALRPWYMAVALALVAAVVLAACGGNGGAYGSTGGGAPSTPTATSAGGAGGDTVTIENFAFTPAKLTVKAGTTVTWTNQDSAAHDVTSTDGPGVDAATTATFASGDMSQGDTFSFTFDTPGTYYYECTIHASMASMHAQVIVQ
jgi:plastocyanin